MKREKEVLLELENFIKKFLADRAPHRAKVERSDCDLPEKIIAEIRNFEHGVGAMSDAILNKITELDKGKEVKIAIRIGLEDYEKVVELALESKDSVSDFLGNTLLKELEREIKK